VDDRGSARVIISTVTLLVWRSHPADKKLLKYPRRLSFKDPVCPKVLQKTLVKPTVKIHSTITNNIDNNYYANTGFVSLFTHYKRNVTI